MKVSAGLASALLIASPLTAQTSPSEGIVVLGPSDQPSCGQWTAARADPRDLVAAQYQMWALGFLSGLNWAQINAREDILRQTDAQAVLSWIDLHCRNHPLDTLLSAVMALDRELAGRHARS